MKQKTWIMQRMAATGVPDKEIAFATAGTWLEETFPDSGHNYPPDAPEIFRAQMEEIGAAMNHATDGRIGVCSRMGEQGFFIAPYQETITDEPDATRPIIRVRSVEEGSAILDALGEIVDFMGTVAAFNNEIESPEHGDWMDVMGHVAGDFAHAVQRAIIDRELKDGPFCLGDALWLRKRYPSSAERSPAGVLIAELAEHCLYELKRARQESALVQHAMPHAGNIRASLENKCRHEVWEELQKVRGHVAKHKPQLRRDVVPISPSAPRKERPRPVAGWQYIPGIQGVESEYCRVLFFRDGEILPEEGGFVVVAGASGSRWRAWLDKGYLAGARIDRDERKTALLQATNTFLYHTWPEGLRLT